MESNRKVYKRSCITSRKGTVLQREVIGFNISMYVVSYISYKTES